MQINVQDKITSIEALEKLYDAPSPRAITKEIDYISDHYRAYIEKAPFVIVATSGPGGLDCTPRGDPTGFVRVHDHKTVLMPDRRGNNRLDTLKNLVHDDRISLLFIIPGLGQTLRINGHASIVTDPALRESFTIQNKVPTTVLVITVDRIYFQCPKALVRSKLWDVANDFDGQAYDEGYPEHMARTIY